MNYRMLGLVALATVASACSGERQEQQPPMDTGTSTTSVAAQETARPARLGHDEADAPAGLSACSVSRHVSAALDTLRRWPRTIVAGGQDECVLAVLDSLGERFIETGGAVWLEVLDSLHAIDDGYVAEYVPELTARMAAARFAEFFTYLFDRRALAPPLESALREAIQSGSEMGQQVMALARERMPRARLDSQQRAYLDDLVRVDAAQQ